MKFILGKKLEMTQIFHDDGRVVPVTAVLAEPNVVTQIKTADKDRYSAVQIGFGGFGSKHINKAKAGHTKGLENVKTMKEFRVDVSDVEKVKRGDKITVKVFENNDIVKVTGVSKGKGFQGVVKRHGFHGSPASHGHKDQLRMPGSIGATDAARVFKGKKMPGRMGTDQVTVAGLEVVNIDVEKNVIYIKGAIPGARNGLIMVSAPGDMDLSAPVVEEVKEDVKAEETVKEVKADMPAHAGEKVEEVKTEEKAVEKKDDVKVEEVKEEEK
jgi:large subunit ribosomal protein L3